MSQITINPALPPGVVITPAIILAAILIWFELRKSQPLLWLRIVCIILVISSLAALGLRPQIITEASARSILLTQNYSPQDIDSLVTKFGDVELIHAPGVPMYKKSKPLLSWNSLADASPDVVVGEGLPPEAIDVIKNKRFQFIPGLLPQGIIQLSLQVYQEGRPGTITGIFNQQVSDSTRIFIAGPGGKEDSVVITGKGKHEFTLNIFPKVSGKAIYTISHDAHTDTLPLTVLGSRALNILFIQNQPDFESNFLKNHLRRKHHVSAHYKISAGKYRNERTASHPDFNRISEDVLKKFELLVVDADALSELTPLERSTLQRAVTDGLGVLIMTGNGITKAMKEWITFEDPVTRSDTVNVSIASKRMALPVWRWDNEQSPQVTPLIKSATKIITATESKGIGKTGFNLLRETYALKLKGDSLQYNELWMTLIDELAEPLSKATTLKIKQPFPVFEGQPVLVEALSSSADLSIYYRNTTLPLLEHPSVPNLYSTKFWAQAPGWDSVRTDHSEYFYTFRSGSWKALTAQARMAATTRIATEDTSAELALISEPLPPWIFYTFFLLGMSILWAIARLYPRRSITT